MRNTLVIVTASALLFAGASCSIRNNKTNAANVPSGPVRAQVTEPGVIPAGTYAGQPEDVPTVAIANILVTHDKVPDELAYRMTKLMFDNLASLGNAHPAARAITLENAPRNLPIPLHPGAQRFFKEKGIAK